MDDAKDQQRRTGRRRGTSSRVALPRATARVLDSLPDAVVATSPDGRIEFVNTLAEQLFGWSRDELLGQPVQMLWPERLRERYTAALQENLANEQPLRFAADVWGVRRDGTEFAGEMSWGTVTTNAGPFLLAVGRDVSERVAAEARLRAVAAIGERALAGADPAELAAEAIELMRITLPLTGAAVRPAGGVALASYGESADGAMRLPVGAGDELLLEPTRELDEEELKLVHAIASILATALAHLRGEEHMRFAAVHDPLTGLANRTLLRDRLQHALARAERGSDATAVLFIDLDDFKHINDAYGHAAGDAVLAELARRLQSAVRPGDTVARFGGDEFVVVCEEVDAPTALAVAERLLDAIGHPITAGGAKHTVLASIGVALGTGDPELLILDADRAVYRAKAAGGGRIELLR